MKPLNHMIPVSTSKTNLQKGDVLWPPSAKKGHHLSRKKKRVCPQLIPLPNSPGDQHFKFPRVVVVVVAKFAISVAAAAAAGAG